MIFVRRSLRKRKEILFLSYLINKREKTTTTLFSVVVVIAARSFFLFFHYSRNLFVRVGWWLFVWIRYVYIFIEKKSKQSNMVRRQFSQMFNGDRLIRCWTTMISLNVITDALITINITRTKDNRWYETCLSTEKTLSLTRWHWLCTRLNRQWIIIFRMKIIVPPIDYLNNVDAIWNNLTDESW